MDKQVVYWVDLEDSDSKHISWDRTDITDSFKHSIYWNCYNTIYQEFKLRHIDLVTLVIL